MTLHEFKLETQFFDAELNGLKSWELREDPGHKFHVGDTLLLKEYMPGFDKSTGRAFTLKITYILRHEDIRKIPENWCILSTREVMM